MPLVDRWNRPWRADTSVSESAPGAARRATAVLTVLLLWLVAWVLLLQQHWLLWQRLPLGVVERFVADSVRSPLPALPALETLAQACRAHDERGLQVRFGGLRRRLAECLADDRNLVQGAEAERAIKELTTLNRAQIAAAERWLQAYEAEAPALRTNQASALKAIQASTVARWELVLAGLAQRVWPQPWAERQAVGRPVEADAVATALRERMQLTRTRLQSLAVAPSPERLRGLALMASGLQLSTDFGINPPRHGLVTDRSTLADALEWQRKASGYQARGFNLAELNRLPASLMLSGLVAVVLVTAFVAQGRVVVTALWALASLLLGASALLLTDLALTGDPAMRYLAERQFIRFGLGDAAMPLVWTLLPDQPVAVWWPLVVAAIGACLVGRLRLSEGRLVGPVRAWVAIGGDARRGWLPTVLLVVAGAVVVATLGMPAAASEMLILLGAVGLATYAAQQAPLVNGGGGLQAYNLWIVAGAVVCAVGGSLWRGDLGHALVAVALAGVFAWLFGGWALRWGTAAAALVLAAALGWCLFDGALVGPMAWLADHLPPHAQDRLRAQFDPYHASASDLARVRWLMASAGTTGWGPGYVPWQGLAMARVQDGLPLQGPSDYVLSLAVAEWGRWGGLVLMLMVLALFTLAALHGSRSALQPAAPVAGRWLSALGAFGCWMMAFKVLLSVGGVAGVLPLTGLPVAMLGYGPVTHLAALLYLALATGTPTFTRPEPVRGVRWRPAVPLQGRARQRNQALTWVTLVALVALVMLSEQRLRQGDAAPARRHVAQARLELAQAVSHALVPVDAARDDVGEGGRSCPELGHAVAAWDERLSNLARPVRMAVGAGQGERQLRLDVARLQDLLPPAYRGACRRLARTLGQMALTDLPRIVGHQTAAAPAEPGGQTRLTAEFEPPRRVGARPLDYTTANAWWGVPGCLHATSSTGQACGAVAQNGAERAEGALSLVQDAWLQRDLAPAVFTALRQPVGQLTVNHRAVAQGPELALTLHPTWQPLAQRVADCFTGRVRGDACAPVLPRDAAWRQRHFEGPDALRAGALGVVVVEVATGRIVALAGAVSDCTLQYLGQPARADAQGRWPALVGHSRCAQWPDRRSGWLAQQHPALWSVPPGSSIKPLTLISGIDAGLVPGAEDGRWKSILAESQLRLPVQRLALSAGQRYLDVLGAAGWSVPELDLAWGGPALAPNQAMLGARWAVSASTGIQGLKPARMGLDEAERIRAENLSPADAHRRHGQAVMADYVAARRLADAALGGADIRVSALGLAHWWRAVDQRAAGQGQAPHLHLIERSGQPVPAQGLDWLSPGAARRVLAMTTGVSSSAWGGTAQGSCRVVFGACPAEGLPGVSGKTGTSDFLTQEDGPFVKPGQQLPAKLFGGVFTAADGRRYAVAATALRVRQAGSATLELSSSAPAEAAFTLMRGMGLGAEFGGGG